MMEQKEGFLVISIISLIIGLIGLCKLIGL